MEEEEIITIKPGTRLQGDGGASSGALVLMNKPALPGSDVILCVSEKSPWHPFVVWTYHHSTGMCEHGDYFDILEKAQKRFEERNY